MKLAQARKRKRVDVTKWFCLSCGGASSQAVAAITAVTWHCLYHGSKELVQHLNRAARFVAASHYEFLRHLHLFRNFFHCRSRNSSFMSLPQVPGLAASHISSAGVCSLSWTVLWTSWCCKNQAGQMGLNSCGTPRCSLMRACTWTLGPAL